jgi:hypothetical protein
MAQTRGSSTINERVTYYYYLKATTEPISTALGCWVRRVESGVLVLLKQKRKNTTISPAKNVHAAG